MTNHWQRALAAILLSIPAALWAEGRTFETDILRETFGFDEATPGTVDLADLHQGCPARDCIPSIDRPRFVGAADADFLADDDLVLAIEVDTDARAYPTRILNYHEIVNDIVAGRPLAITWCPLCGSGLAFEREFDGGPTEFGVSGVLFNSDLVMYDRRTGTLWDQVRGLGIVGPLTGSRLQPVPLSVTRWGQWRAAHPSTRVLSPDTGHDLDYDVDPYERYREGAGLMFPVGATDDRVGPKTVVFGAFVDGQYIAWTERLLADQRRLEDRLGERELTVVYGDDGAVVISDAKAGREFVPVRLFWFAWYAFHPETVLRDVDG